MAVLFVLAGIAAPILSWTLSAVVIVTWSGYDPVSQSISLLADAPLGWIQTLAFAISGVLGIFWAFGLPSVLGATSRQQAIVRLLLIVQAVLAIGFALFPTDRAARAVTTIGTIHLAIFYIYAVTMPLTLVALGLVMRRDTRWAAVVGPTIGAGILVVLATLLVPATLDGPLTPWLGLLERVYVAIPSGWQVGAGIIAWRMLRTV